MLVLLGESGSGKSAVERGMVSRGYKRAISHTTRSPRDNEVEGIDYFFVSEGELDKLWADGLLGERIYYMGNTYALHVDQIKNDGVAVVIPEGLRQLRERGDLDILSVYLYVSEEERYKRMLGRGDREEDILKRLKNDRDNFSGVREVCDLVLDVGSKSVEEVCGELFFFLHKGRVYRKGERT